MSAQMRGKGGQVELISEAFSASVDAYRDLDFLAMPADKGRAYHPLGYSIRYGEARGQVEQLVQKLSAAGYGHGHRIAALLGNRPELYLLKLAYAELGISWVPINPDYRAGEVAYLLQDSGVELAIFGHEFEELIRTGLRESGRSLPLVPLDGLLEAASLPTARTAPPLEGGITGETESSLIYTSGTTGRPKGCRLGQQYELMIGQRYLDCGGVMTLREGKERLYNPLPAFHVNAAMVSFFGVMLSGNCQIQPARFSKSAWWRDIREMEASIVHYLGIVIPVLMSVPESEEDKSHSVRFGVGAGLEPSLHRPFEARFGFPLVEIWGMTEMCRVLGDSHEPRAIDTRAIGFPADGLEVKVVDQDNYELPRGTPGEMVVRHSAETPRKGAFLGYLNLPEETEKAWEGGWFHTGDTVTQDEAGRIYFVDRSKNIIRRSGENIAAAEVEACIQACPEVAQAAVLAVPDPIREEEVMACVVLSAGIEADEIVARRLFDHCFKSLAYYKAPGFVHFRNDLPVTGTQKVQKHEIFSGNTDISHLEFCFDFRASKNSKPLRYRR